MRCAGMETIPILVEEKGDYGLCVYVLGMDEWHPLTPPADSPPGELFLSGDFPYEFRELVARPDPDSLAAWLVENYWCELKHVEGPCLEDALPEWLLEQTKAG